MTITETVLVFVGIPLAVILVVYGLVYGGSAARGKRYRPGRPYTPTPVWFVANTPANAPSAHASGHAITASPTPAALSGDTEAAEAEAGTKAEPGTEAEDRGLATVHYGETGGASDSW